MRTITSTLLAAGAALAVAVPSVTATAATPALNAADITFVKANATSDLTEITIGTLALQKSTNGAVRHLAKVTIADHQAALAKLMPVAEQVGVALPTAPRPAEQAAAATLATLPEPAFDKAYLHAQVKGHVKSIAITRIELTSGVNPSVKDFASYYLPVAKMHLTMTEHAQHVLFS